MSYSSDVKEELSKINNFKNIELIAAEFLGYILSANTILNLDDVVEFITENEFNIERFYKILFSLKLEYEPEIRGKVFVAKIKKDENLFKYLVLKQDLQDEVKRAIVKGCFLGAGSVSNPEKQNHLEIVFSSKENLEYVNNICRMYNINLKELITDDKYMLYIKDGEEISKFLALIGANKAVLEYEDIRIIRELKNNINRKVNCETANLNKTVSASVVQVDDIKLIMKLKKFEELPDYLKEIAYVRLENPDASLKELGDLLENKISKSGVNHRLKKIHEIADELRGNI